MKLGLLEIFVIILLVQLVLLAVRIIGAGRPSVRDVEKGKKSSLQIPDRQVEQSSGKGHQLRLAGIVFALISVLLLLAGMSMFKWVMKAYLWSFILLAIGLMILFMSRKK